MHVTLTKPNQNTVHDYTEHTHTKKHEATILPHSSCCPAPPGRKSSREHRVGNTTLHMAGNAAAGTQPFVSTIATYNEPSLHKLMTLVWSYYCHYRTIQIFTCPRGALSGDYFLSSARLLGQYGKWFVLGFTASSLVHASLYFWHLVSQNGHSIVCIGKG